MKKFKILLTILIAVLITPNLVYADSDSSGENGGGAGISNSCKPNCKGIQRSSSVAGVRITFVDATGKAVAETGGKSFDFITKNRFNNITVQYNAFSGDRGKFGMLGGGNFTQGAKGTKDYKLFSAVAKAYYDLVPGKTKLINTSGYTGGGLDGFSRELNFFLSITKKGNPTYAQDVNAFIKAIASVTGEFSADKLLYRVAEGCKSGDEIFIIMEPIFFYSNMENGVNYLATFTDHYNMFGGEMVGGASNLNNMMWLMYYEREIPAFKGAIGVGRKGYTAQTGAQFLSNVGFGLAVDWANDPAEGCQSCSFFGDKFVYDDKTYPGDLVIPQKFSSIYEFAFKKDPAGANCCELLKDQLDGKDPAWKEAYDKYCKEDNPDCCDEKVPKEPADFDINNCCEESTTSFINENLINDLFCYDSKLEVPYYLKKCDLDDNYYLDKENDLNSKYCEMYCSQRVTLEQPEAITAVSGRYFKLGTTSIGTTGPVIEGFRRCRVRIAYNDWLEDYKEKIKKERDLYNQFQELSAKQKTYQDAARTEATVEGQINIEVKCSDGTTDHPITETYEYSYKKYTFNNLYTYNRVKVDERIDGIDISPDTPKKYDHSKYSTYGLEEAKEAADKAKEAAEAKCIYNTHSATRDLLPDEGQGYPDENVKSIPESIDFDAKNKQFKAAVADAQKLEEELDKCDNYFIEGDGADAEKSYKFDPNVDFKYSEVYKDEIGMLQDSMSTVELAKTCTYDIKLNKDDTDSETSEDYYSKIYGNGKTVLRGFQSINLTYHSDSKPLSDLYNYYNADKKFSTDAKYHAKCTWNEKSNEVHTLVPTGIVSKDESPNMTTHDKEYKLYITTLEGKYQTYWNITGLGQNGSLDNMFKEYSKNTCANQPAKNSEEALTCTLSVKRAIIYTGSCRADNEFNTTTKKEECEPSSSEYTLFSFKVADAVDLFPSGVNTEHGEVAQNWIQEETGIKVKEELEQKGKNDKVFAPENISYSFRLSSTDMKAIKKYNAEKEQDINAGGYSDFEFSCSCPKEVIVNSLVNPKACTKCKSNFITSLANGTIKYDGSEHRISVWNSSNKLENIRRKILKG